MIRARFREALESSGHVDIFYNELLPRSGHEFIFMLGFFVFINILNLFLCSLCLFSSADIFFFTLNFPLLIAKNISAFVEVLSTLFLWLPIG